LEEITMTILIKNGTIITDADIYQADIHIVGEKIFDIGDGLQDASAELIDAKDMLVLPGGVDPHTHFDLPMFGTVSSDDHYSGHKAAAFGGTTTVLDFVPQDDSDLIKDIEHWLGKAEKKAAIDYGFHMNITTLDEKVMKQIPLLGDLGVTSLKVFTAYNHRLRLQDGEIFRVMRIAKDADILTMIHAEDGDAIEIMVDEALQQGKTDPVWHARTRPAWGAVQASFKAATLAGETGAAVYIVHMNVAGEVDILKYARERGLSVMGETCPQYLFFTEDQLLRQDGSKWVCSPPMRTTNDNQRLWVGLKDGTIQTIGTDHCAFFYDGTRPIEYEGKLVAIPGKELGRDDFTKIPNGLPGVGDRLPILWSYGVRANRITPNQFVALTSTNPAKIFGLYPKKGAILPGSDADIAIWDPEVRLTYGIAYAHHRTDYNLYEGWELQGYPQKVLLRGQLIVNNDQWLGHAGFGQYILRHAGAEIL
jgi:dihydropyrimidinase